MPGRQRLAALAVIAASVALAAAGAGSAAGDEGSTPQLRPGDQAALSGRGALAAASADPLPPDTNITFGPEGWTNVRRPVFGYESDNPEAWFECRLDSGPFEPCGPATYEVLEGHPWAQLSEGIHAIEVRAVGPGGDVDPTPAQAVFTVDAQPPSAAILSGPNGVTHQQRPRFGLRVAGEDSFRCRIIGKNVKITVPSCDGPTSFTPPRALPEGTYELVVAARDLAANETEDRVEFSVRTKPGSPPDPYRGSLLYIGRGDGVKKVVFRLEEHRLIEARITVNLACGGGGRRHRYRSEVDYANPRWPIAVDKQGGFRKYVQRTSAWEDETVRLVGQIAPQRIAGSIAVSWTQPARVGNETCHTGHFESGGMKELSFHARLAQ